MGILSWARAVAESTPPPSSQHHRYTVDIDECGNAEAVMYCGDADGSGEMPCVVQEIRHDFLPGGVAAVAYSAREAELVARGLLFVAGELKPHERLRTRHQKWKREVADLPPLEQPHPTREREEVSIDRSEIDAILATTDPRLEKLRQKLTIPF
jgi:hypothetical protein